MTDQREFPARPRRMQGWTRSSEQAAPVERTSAKHAKPTAAEEQAAQNGRRRRMGSAQASSSVSANRTARRHDGAFSAEGASVQSEQKTSAPNRRRLGGAATPAAAAPPTATTVQTSPTPAERSGDHTSTVTDGPSSSEPAKTRSAWVKPVLITAAVLAGTVLVVLLSRWLRTLGPIEEFIATYSGHTQLPETAPVGLPAWIGWQHFFNMFLMVLIIRTGWQVRTERKPAAHWTPKKNSFFAPKGSTPKKVSLTQWLHQALDVLWMLNGAVFIVLLFSTGQWMRIVPTSWDIFPHMASTALQYASLDWPLENGWVHYNALQVMAYFITVFIAAPLAVLSGIRFSTWWPDKNAKLNKLYPVEVARAIHFPVMLYFVAFTVVHVFLVFFTGALRNLNHMYTSRDVVDAWGLIILLASLLVIAAGWFLTRPEFIAPIASKTGKLSR